MITLLTNQSNIDLSLVDGKESGRTALHLVTQKLKENKTKRRMDDVDRYRKCLEILVTNRGQETHRPMININAQDCFGNTALHYVSRSGMTGCCTTSPHDFDKNYLQVTNRLCDSFY